MRDAQPESLKEKVRHLPDKPGVYLMKDRLGSIIYVGKARDLRKRMSSYFLASRKTRADLKTRALIDTIADFEFHTVRNEAESLLLEGKLIKDYRPRYNVAFRDEKRFLLVKLQPSEPWPRFVLTRGKVAVTESEVKAEQGHGRFVGREPNSPVNRALSTWKEITAPRRVERAGIPQSGV